MVEIFVYPAYISVFHYFGADMTSITDKDQRQLLQRYPALVVTHTRRHLKISNTATGDFVIAPVSGSDWRGLRNLERDLRRLDVTGEGYLARSRCRHRGTRKARSSNTARRAAL